MRRRKLKGKAAERSNIWHQKLWMDFISVCNVYVCMCVLVFVCVWACVVGDGSSVGGKAFEKYSLTVR